MDLDLHKRKKRYTEMDDEQLLRAAAEPPDDATERMLIEAELTRRNLSVTGYRGLPAETPLQGPRRSGRWLTWLFVLFMLVSVFGNLLREAGPELIDWLREFFGR